MRARFTAATLPLARLEVFFLERFWTWTAIGYVSCLVAGLGVRGWIAEGRGPINVVHRRPGRAEDADGLDGGGSPRYHGP